MNKLRFNIAALACLLFSSIASAKEADLAQRLADLSASLEKARQEQNIPGMAIAIVKDDKVIFTNKPSIRTFISILTSPSYQT